MIHRITSEIRFRLRALFNRASVERDLDDELQHHLDIETERNASAGFAQNESAWRAKVALGGVQRIKDDTRDARGIEFVDQCLRDIRYALRGLRARKAFAAGVILTLGLAVGANATMFGIVDRMLFRAPPMLHDQQSVHRIYRHSTPPNEVRIDRNLAFPVYLDVMRYTRSFSTVAAFQTRTLPVGRGDGARDALVTIASASYFDLFDATPARGRFIESSDDSIGAPAAVAVLGYAFWQAQFGGADVIGQTLLVDRTPCTIIGVAPKDFVGMSDQGVPAVYIPITTFALATRGPAFATQYGSSWLELVVRRRAGVSLKAAEADVAASLRQSWRNAARPGWKGPEESQVRAELTPVQMGRGPQASGDTRLAAWVSGVAAIVLLIACANVANLFLARAVARRREIAMRLALGVSRGRLARQLFTETLVIASIGGVLGLALAQWGADSLRAWFLPLDTSAGVLLDARTLAFTVAATLIVALVTGLVPALDARNADVSATLKSGARDTGFKHVRARSALLVAQVALSMVLLIGAGVFVASLWKVDQYRVGYDTEHVLAVRASMRGMNLTPSEFASLNARMLDAARSVPGVVSATIATSVPFRSNEEPVLAAPGVDSVPRLGRFLLQAGSPAYFETTGTRVLRGRAFDASDGAGSPPVVLVSEGMARRIWPNTDPIGKCLQIGGNTMPCAIVVGVTEDIRLRRFVDDREFTYYIPVAHYVGQYAGVLSPPQLFARVTTSGVDIEARLRARLQALMPGNAFVTVSTMSSLVEPNLRAWKMGATMFVGFGGLAALLSAIGLASLLAYDVAQRRRDLSIRVALGARRSQMVGLVLRRGAGLVAGGIVIGLAIAAWAAPSLESLMFRQSPRDPLVFVWVAAGLLIVGLLATLGPALRASRADAMAALRSD